MTPKIPRSVLVVLYTADGQVLLLERADHAGFWQSVTGSLDHADEPLTQACAREVAEETGHRAESDAFADWQLTHRYPIYPHWRHRYAAGVAHNVEHVFGLWLPAPFAPVLAPREHRRSCWLPWRAAADQCFSWTNAQAVRQVPLRLGARAD